MEKRHQEVKDKLEKAIKELEDEDSRSTQELIKLLALEKAILSLEEQNEEIPKVVAVKEDAIPQGAVDAAKVKELIIQRSYQPSYSRTNAVMVTLENNALEVVKLFNQTALRAWKIAEKLALKHGYVNTESFRTKVVRVLVVLEKAGKIRRAAWGKYTAI